MGTARAVPWSLGRARQTEPRPPAACRRRASVRHFGAGNSLGGPTIGGSVPAALSGHTVEEQSAAQLPSAQHCVPAPLQVPSPQSTAQAPRSGSPRPARGRRAFLSPRGRCSHSPLPKGALALGPITPVEIALARLTCCDEHEHDHGRTHHSASLRLHSNPSSMAARKPGDNPTNHIELSLEVSVVTPPATTEPRSSRWRFQSPLRD